MNNNLTDVEKIYLIDRFKYSEKTEFNNELFQTLTISHVEFLMDRIDKTITKNSYIEYVNKIENRLKELLLNTNESL
jgi:hypothetical protein